VSNYYIIIHRRPNGPDRSLPFIIKANEEPTADEAALLCGLEPDSMHEDFIEITQQGIIDMSVEGALHSRIEELEQLVDQKKRCP
jgi:hypothetical protein